ncbi:MAG: PAS domain-containing protein [Chloroflexaceae bacterium]
MTQQPLISPDTARIWQPTLASLFDLWQHVLQDRYSAHSLGRALLTVVAEATHAAWASLMAFDPDRRQLQITEAIGLPETVVQSTCVALGEGIAGWVALHRQPLLLAPDYPAPPHLVSYMRRDAIGSALCVPMISDGELYGVLNLARKEGEPLFTEEDLWFAALVAERQALALKTAQLYAELARRERFMERIMESLPLSLVVLNRRLQVVLANQNFFLKLRRNAHQTIGRTIKHLFPAVLLQYMRLEQRVKDVFASGEPFDGEKVAYTAPGLGKRNYFYRLVPLKQGASVDHVLLLIEDVTEREKLGEEVRRVERHLAGVVNQASDLVVSLTPDGKIITWNPAAEQISGLKAEQVCGEPFVKLCAPGQNWMVHDLLRRLAAGEAVKEIEISLLGADPQHPVVVAWNCSAMRDDAGTVVGIIAVGRDLTERRRLEAQMVQVDKMVSLGVMAGGIAHELRNPLAVIQTNAQLLEEYQDHPELTRQCLQHIVASTRRAALIIENLLKFARPPQDRYRLLNIHNVLEETLALLANQLLMAKVELVRAFAPDVPMIYGNPVLLQQVFTNLILNAVAAMPQGGRITLKTRSVSEQIEIQVRDTGVGIAPEHLSRIFDPFFTTRPVGMGVGLGLSISYSIVQQHHGAISVDSQPGQGTCFTIRLPADA